jgi:DNA adenine methylase
MNLNQDKNVNSQKRKIKNMNNKAKPFIKWVGGKTQLIESIEKTLPENFSELSDVTYIEPFVGGGAVLFWILQQYPNITKAVINDINADLSKSYKTIKESPFELVEHLQCIQDEYLQLNEDSRKEYFLLKRDKFNTKCLEPIENTALFIFLNRTCFNGLYRVNSKGLFNVPFGRYANPKICDKQTILADSELLQKVEILTGDFEETLKYASKNSFFYFDPPYKPLSETSSFNSYSKEDFNDQEQIRLGNFCKKIDLLGHRFVLSNSDVKGYNPNDDFFDDLYEQFNIKRVYATRMINSNGEKRGKLTELLVANQLLGKTFDANIYPKVFLEV